MIPESEVCRAGDASEGRDRGAEEATGAVQCEKAAKAPEFSGDARPFELVR